MNIEGHGAFDTFILKWDLCTIDLTLSIRSILQPLLSAYSMTVYTDIQKLDMQSTNRW